MADQEWVRPLAPAEPAGTAWTGKPESRFELRPLSLGEILDRTFALYRSRFWLFAGIAMLAAAIHVISLGISLTAAQRMARVGVTPSANPLATVFSTRMAGTAQLSSYLVGLIFFLVSSVTQAATALALTRTYMHHDVTVKSALGAVLPRWYRWIAIQFWKIGSLIWVPIAAAVPGLVLIGLGSRSGNSVLIGIGGLVLALAVLAGMPVGVILYLRNALAIPASVTEGLTIRPAMRRSKVLAAGTKGRIFVVALVAGALLEIVGVLQAPAMLLMMYFPGQQHYLARGLSLVLAFVGHTVVMPIGEIGATLLYFDQRVRKEALDVELLLQGARQTPESASAILDAAPGHPEGYAPLR